MKLKNPLNDINMKNLYNKRLKDNSMSMTSAMISTAPSPTDDMQALLYAGYRMGYWSFLGE